MDSQETDPHRFRRRLGRLLGAAAATLLAVGAVAMSGGVAHAATTITSNSTGTSNGYFYSFWEQDAGGATMTLGSGSNYQLSWTSASNDVVAGTGWATGSTAPVTYSGTWNCNGNCYLSLYGWTTNPLVEFYITDAYGDYNPSSGDSLLGTVNSDGGTYDLYEHQQVNQPCITGSSCTFEQYWAVRTSQRIGGTITVANIFNAWAALGLNLGTPNYEILATEGYQSSGSSNITVSQGGTTTGGGNTVTVTNPGTQTATVGTAVSKQLSATDSGGASLAYSATGLPAGLSISSSGDITGTPTTAGTSSVTVTAKDSTGATGTTTFTYTVNSSGGTTGGGGGNRNAYQQIAADSYDAASGVTTEAGDGGTVVSLSGPSSYIAFNGVQFGSPGAASVSFRDDNPTAGLNLQVRLGSPSASPACTVYPNGNGTWTLSSNSCYPMPSGTQTVYITSTGAVQINYLVFTQQ